MARQRGGLVVGAGPVGQRLNGVARVARVVGDAANGGVGGGGLVPAAVVNCTQKSNINKVKILFIS